MGAPRAGQAGGFQMSDATIQEIKERFGVVTDADLARALGVDKSTISSWRRRAVVPQKYLKASPTEPLPSMAKNADCGRRLFSMREIVGAHKRALLSLPVGKASDLNSFLVAFLLELEEGDR